MIPIDRYTGEWINEKTGMELPLTMKTTYNSLILTDNIIVKLGLSESLSSLSIELSSIGLE